MEFGTNLSVYKIIFTIQLLIAMYLFSFKLEKRKMPALRYAASGLISIGSAVLFPIFSKISYSWWYSTIMFFTIFAISSSTLFIIYKASWKKIFLIAISAYTAQHLSYQIYSILCVLFKFDTNLQSAYNSDTYQTALTIVSALKLLVMLVVYTLIYVGCYRLFISRMSSKNAEINNFSIILLSGLILLIDIVINAVVVYNVDSENMTTSVILCTYNVLSCLMVLFILFFLLDNKTLKDELLIQKFLLKQAEEKYKQSKENRDLINVKCHDLKHQIRKYGKAGNMEKETIKDLENMIEIYDSTMDTGNSALDLILTEKVLMCRKQEIALKCFADCSKLSFISDSDIYNLFGNAIDNAIEAALKVDDKEMRKIDVIVKNINSFCSITVQNFFSGELKLDTEGLPKTTKDDLNYHGFGLKSIQLITDKYHGDLKISIQDQIFTLSLLFPLPQGD